MARFTQSSAEGAGLPGPQGAPGDSAYAVALQNGFSGTEAEWLNSLKGADGQDGVDGIDGADGEQGPKGDKGDTGDQGVQGIQGLKGDKGDQGEQGVKGDTGLQGLKGDTGETGAQGEIGPQGQQGIQGIQGVKGDKGDKGDTGATGPAGQDGNNGTNGTNGTNGSDGADGVDGESAYQVAVNNGFVGTEPAWLLSLVGAKGDTGNNGQDGQDGDSFIWRGPWDVANTYSKNDVVSNNGNSYIAVYDITTPNIFAITDTEHWQLMSVKGAQGEPGQNGLDGADGQDAVWNFTGAYNLGSSYAVGDLATYNGTTWYRLNSNGGNTGDTPAENVYWTAISIKGDTGATGSQGPQGEIGLTGPKGDTGETGATGPKGDKGDTGLTGSQGIQGEKGDKGDTGLTGSQGIQGEKGDKGDTGSTGPQGVQGIQGIKGDTGAKGDTGSTGPAGADGDRYLTTSSTTLLITDSGQANITVGTGLAYSQAQTVLISKDESNYMHGIVYSYNNTTGLLVVNLKSKTGSGTYSSWIINIDGAPGADGAQGATGLSGATGAKGDTGATGPAGPGIATGGTTGQVLSKIDSTDYNTQWIDMATIAAGYTSTIKHEVKAAQSITKGQAVYVSSADGTNMIVSKASNAGESTSSKTMGLLEATVSTNGKTNVITEGLLAGLNTNGATAGDPVWLGTDGNLIFGLTNKPVAPAHLVFIGVVTRANSSNGEIFIRPQNGFELNELHDVLIGTGYSSTPANRDLLSYDLGSSLWKNKTAAQLGLATLDGAETLTNKTLGNPTINGFLVTSPNGTTNLGSNIVTGTLSIVPNLTGGTVNIANGADFNGIINIGTAGGGVTQEEINIGSTTGSTLTTINGTVILPEDTQIGNVTRTEISYLDGVTSSIQSQLDSKIGGAHAHTISDVSNLQLRLNEKAPLASPTFTGTVTLPSETSIGDVSATEISYLNGVTSNIQTQFYDVVYLDAAQVLTQKTIALYDNFISGTTSEFNSALTDGDFTTLAGTETLTNKTLTSPKINEDVAVTATATEINYLDGVTSAIQTQLDSKVGSDHSHTSSNITDFTEAAQDAIGGILGSGLLYSDASNTITVNSNVVQLRVGNVSDTEIGYLDGVTSSIQTQLNTKADLLSPTITMANLASASSTVDPLTISTGNGHGGTGYAGLMTLENTSSGATNPKKFIRLNSTGTLEIINSAYTATLLGISDSGILTFPVASGVTANVPGNGGISLNGHSYIFDDGNMHITATDGSIWINSNSASPVQINTQGNAVGGGMTVSGKVNSDNTGDSGWIAISTFSNSFAGTDVAYRKLNNVVYLRGRVQSGTLGTTAFTLPTGYRPGLNGTYAVQQYGTANMTYITINTDGTVAPSQSSAWLSGVCFPVG
jgi:hypothetical protein